MTDYYIKLVTTTLSGLEYHFNLVENLDGQDSLPSSRTPSNPVENSQVTALKFKQRDIPISWILYDNGEDKSNGSWSTSIETDSRISNSSIQTTTEQQIFLERYLFNNNLGAQWRLFGGKFTDPDGDGTNEGTPVTIENLNIRTIASRPQVKQGTMRLKVGQRV